MNCGRKAATVFRQRNGLGSPRLLRFEKKLEEWLLALKDKRNANRLKLGKPALPLIAVIEDVLRAAMLKQKEKARSH